MNPGYRSPRSLGPRFAAFFRITEPEGLPVLLAGGYFFFLLAAYYVLQPLRDELALQIGTEHLPALFRWTLVLMLVLNPVYSWFVSRFPRRKVIAWFYRLSSCSILAFYGGLRFLPPEWGTTLTWVFYLWVNIFNLFAISIFWSVMVDRFTPLQGKRLFGLLAAGGTSGQLVGSGLTTSLAGLVPTTVDLLLLSWILLEVALFCLRRLLRSTAEVASPNSASAVKKSNGSSALAGFREVLGSPYLLGICLFMLLYTFTSTFLYFEKQDIVASVLSDRAARLAYFSRINLLVAGLTLAIQVFLTGRMIASFGLTAMLCVLPLLTALGFLVLGLSPTLLVIAGFEVLRRTANFALTRPAREVLFTVLPPLAKYRAKSVLDTFVYRGGDALSSWVFEYLQALRLGVSGIALVAVALALLWTGVAFGLGRHQATMQARGAHSPSPGQKTGGQGAEAPVPQG